MNVYADSKTLFGELVCAATEWNGMDLEKFMRKLNRYGNVLMLFFIFETIAQRVEQSKKKLKLDFM